MRAGLGVMVAVLLGCALMSPPAGAQNSGSGAVPLAARADGAAIERVDVVLVRSGGNAARDEALVARLRSQLAGFAGRGFNRASFEAQLATLRRGAGKVDWRLLDSAEPGRLVVQVEIDTSQEAAGLPPGPAGVAAGNPGAFPLIWQDERSNLTAIVGGGFGVYSDRNPWFGRPDLFAAGSPIAGRLPGRQPAWTEGYVELGFGGAVQIGDNPLYAYGVLTAMTTWSLGQDIYRNDARSVTGIERAFAGLIYIDPETGGRLNVSAGRQLVTLNDGFLIHFVRGSANIGERGGTYLGPRNANDFSVVADASVGPWTLKGFYIDPNELGIIESNSTFAGGNLRFAITPDLAVDASVITIPRSDGALIAPGGVRLPRQGVVTYAVHGRWNRAFGFEGVWLESELVHQRHEHIAMSTFAGYGLVGYRAVSLPWTPSLSYRYFQASGDDPSTPTYERYDPLLSTGLGNWLQGISFGKITSNSNLTTHRLQFNVTPDPRLNVTFDWHLLRAVERNNLGANPVIGTLSSPDLGQEFTLSARWALTRNFYFQGIASVALPGAALKAVGARDPWTTLQASLYWSL